MYIHVLMRDEKERIKNKQDQPNNKAKQHSTPNMYFVVCVCLYVCVYFVHTLVHVQERRSTVLALFILGSALLSQDVIQSAVS